MATALETRGLTKSYRAGTGVCVASMQVLHGIDLVLHTGDAIGLLGERGAGKSTLLLCLAGLLGADTGTVRWFGESTLASAARHVLYHSTRTDLLRCGNASCSHIHLVDVPPIPGISPDLDHWIELQRLSGDAVIVASRYRSMFPPDLPVYSLSHGRLKRPDERAKVAEVVASASARE